MVAGESGASRGSPWPELRLAEWADTWDTLHLWLQVVGKIRLELEPMVNHWWQVPLYVSARGLTTSLMHPPGGEGLEIEFDFVRQDLVLRTTGGAEGFVALRPRSVADFFAVVMRELEVLGMPVRIYPVPSEVPDTTRLDRDEAHGAYEPEAARRFWTVLVQAHQVLRAFRSRFIGKASPVHFFWGGGDLASSRFSGRRAPKHPGGVPNSPDWVQRLAYSHQVSSCGFWPGGSEEGSFYAYAYPTPMGFGGWPVTSPGVFDPALGEFVLPYAAVREADDPAGVVMRFFQETYEGAAELGGWDRAALEAPFRPA